MPAGGSELFLDSRRRPRLVRCAVLFIDMLGVSEMNRAKGVARHLIDLERAVTATYRDYLSPFSPWPSAFFSDTLVLAAPLIDRDEMAEVVFLATQAASLQMSLARSGFFVRGGLAIDRFHIREGLVFGPALVEAYELESKIATHPRVVLSAEAEDCLARALAGPTAGYPLVLADGDGRTFINYLELQLAQDLEDPALPAVAHRDRIVSNLDAHRSNKKVWEKYRWAAEYHNDVLRRTMPRRNDLLVQPEPMTWGFRTFL